MRSPFSFLREAPLFLAELIDFAWTLQNSHLLFHYYFVSPPVLCLFPMHNIDCSFTFPSPVLPM